MEFLSIPTAVLTAVQLEERGFRLNDYAREYLQHPAIGQAVPTQSVPLVLCRIGELGLNDGCSLSQILERSRELGYGPCHPLTGVFLRLHLSEQPESNDPMLTGRHRAPDGSITVLSIPLSRDDAFPKGLYLRNAGGKLWLRGFVCDDSHGWSASDQVVLKRSAI